MISSSSHLVSHNVNEIMEHIAQLSNLKRCTRSGEITLPEVRLAKCDVDEGTRTALQHPANVTFMMHIAKEAVVPWPFRVTKGAFAWWCSVGAQMDLQSMLI